jgi:hypothetical protein
VRHVFDDKEEFRTWKKWRKLYRKAADKEKLAVSEWIRRELLNAVQRNGNHK